MAPDLAASFRKLMSSDKPANGEAQHVQPKSSSSKAAPPHPLDALSPDEINAVGRAVRLHFSEKTDVKAVKVMYITLIEPPKLDVLRFLGIPTSVDEIGKVQPDHSILISRRAETVVIDAVTGRAYCIQATLSSGGTSIDDVELLPAGVEPGITVEELCECEETVRNDPRVQQLCRDVGVEPHQIACDGWSIGYDARFPGRRLQQALLYARLEEHEAFYAHPLDFSPVVDSNRREVIHIDFPPHRLGPDGKISGNMKPLTALTADSFTNSGRDRIPPSMQRFDYLPDLLKQHNPDFKMREDVKPLHITQPEGVSFTLEGSRLKWQNWDLHITPHYREGLVLSTITYNDHGVVRPLFYRLSLAEMVVPYAAPEWPHPRKHALDVGEYGMGVLSNSLGLGCDCLGTVAYCSLAYANHAGQAVITKNAICIHEEDAGILYKHTDFRPGGRGHSVRSRVLIIQMVCTIANYEYIINFRLHQDGNLGVEIKLTGILNLYTMAEGERAGLHGTEVAPRVMGHHHQHLFSMRIDPMLDGINNSVVETDVVPSDAPTGSEDNWAGNSFETRKTILSTTADGVRDAAPQLTRTWSIVNEGKLHYASRQPAGYKIMAAQMPPLLAKPDSIVAKRAPFAQHSLWCAPYDPQQLYPAGKYVPQTQETPKDAITSFVDGNRNIRNTDVAVWLTWGVTHVVRPEDFPVMPVEHCSLLLKPTSFFDMNPALDVPASSDKFSVPYAHAQVSTNGSCCA